MKRSHAIMLGATGVIVAGAWIGSGKTRIGDDDAGKTVEAAIYADAGECIAANVLSREICEAEFKKATESHVATAPKFSDKSGCEAQYGANQCRSTSFNGASVFIPAMIGLLVANHLTNRRQSQPLYSNRNAAPACPPGATPQINPGCSTSRSYTTSSGYGVSRAAGQATNAVVRVAAAAATPPLARTTITPVGGQPSRIITSNPASTSPVARGGFGTTGSGHSISSSS